MQLARTTTAEDGSEPGAAAPPDGQGAPGAPVRFDLRLMESFVVLADELHFGRAAERLSFAQPALSQRIRRLEQQVGSSLFDRDSRRVELTDAGQAFLEHARVSLAAAAAAMEAVAASARTGAGRLPLSIGTDALDVVRDLLRAFAAAHPEVQLDMTVQYDVPSVQALARRDVDSAVLWSGAGPPAGFETTSALLAAPGAGIALRESHPLAALDEIGVDRLRGQRLVMFPRTAAAAIYDEVLARLGDRDAFRAIHHVTLLGGGVLSDMLAALDDESVMPAACWRSRHDVPEGVTHRPLAPHLPSTIWLVWEDVPTWPVAALAAFADRAARSDGALAAAQG